MSLQKSSGNLSCDVFINSSLLLIGLLCLIGCNQQKLAEKKADTPSKNVPVATSDQVSPQAVETDIQPKPIESLVDIGQQAQKRLEEINVRFDSEVEELESAIAQISSESKKAELFNKQNPEPQYTKDLFELASKFPETDAAFEATMSIILQRKSAVEFPDAMDLAVKHYGDRVQWQKICEGYLEEVPSPQLEGWMRAMIANSSSDATRTQVIQILYEYFDQFPTFATTIAYNPQIEKRLPKEQVQYIYSRKKEVRDDLLVMMKDLRDQYGVLKDRKGRSFKDVVDGPIFELEHLNEGQVAPDIIGEDFDGIEFRLSDYRGKVILLDFWGQWCPHCRDMYPHERELVEKMVGKPFVLIGVNSDRRLEFARKAAEDENLIWRNFWIGPKGRAGPIAKQWNVSAWPTVYLIDAKGVIRYKEVLGHDIDSGLQVLMEEMGYPNKVADENRADIVPFANLAGIRTGK